MSNNAAALNLAAQLGQTGSLLVFGISVILRDRDSTGSPWHKDSNENSKGRVGHRGVAGITYIGLSLATKNSTFVSNFNSLSGTNVTAVISSAQSQGFDPTVTLFGTIFGFVYMFLNFTGFNFSTYLSGEVRNVRRSRNNRRDWYPPCVCSNRDRICPSY